jgi:hypothetical protein
MKLWRIQLHRIDIRKFVATGRTKEGHILIGSSEPESGLQELIEKERPRSVAFESAMGLFHWGRSAFEGRAINDNWREQLLNAQMLVTTGPGSEYEYDLAAGGPAYVAAVCIRDPLVGVVSGTAGMVCADHLRRYRAFRDRQSRRPFYRTGIWRGL